MIKTAIVTGATSGIGRATALMLARLGYNVAITGRRLNLLRELCNEIEKTSGVETYILNFNVSDKNDVFDSYDMIPDSWKKYLSVLVNNAGVAIGDENFEQGDDREWDEMVDTNVKGILYISQLAAHTMKENGRGLIINISDIAGRTVREGNSVYGASKAAVDMLTRSMRVDLAKCGIKVASVTPGVVNTDFIVNKHRGNMERAAREIEGFKPLSAADVAAAVEFIVTRPEHVCIDDLVLTPKQQIPY